MGFLNFVANYWYWVLIAYVVLFVLFAVGAGWDYYRTASRADADADADTNGAGTDTGTDSDSDGNADCRANLHRAVNRKSRHRSVVRAGDWSRVGRHDANGDPVLTNEKAVA